MPKNLLQVPAQQKNEIVRLVVESGRGSLSNSLMQAQKFISQAARLKICSTSREKASLLNATIATMSKSNQRFAESLRRKVV